MRDSKNECAKYRTTKKQCGNCVKSTKLSQNSKMIYCKQFNKMKKATSSPIQYGCYVPIKIDFILLKRIENIEESVDIVATKLNSLIEKFNEVVKTLNHLLPMK